VKIVELDLGPYMAECTLCDWSQTWTTVPAAQKAAVWHVYEQHLTEWTDVVGDRPPADHRPETLGQQL
jgi:hypothetical protein